MTGHWPETPQTAQYGEKPPCWAFTVDWGIAALKGGTRQRSQKRSTTACSWKHLEPNRQPEALGVIRISVVSFTLTSLNNTTEMLFYSLRSA
jgi:hypothetical protein